MKQRFLSLCLVLVMIFSTVFGVIPASTAEAAELPERITLKGGDNQSDVEGVTPSEINMGTETDSEGNEVSYCQITKAKYSNALWNVTFPYAGTWQLSFRAAVKIAAPKLHVEYREKGVYADDTNAGWSVIYDNEPYFTVTDTTDAYNTYQTFDDPAITVDIRKAGEYTFKIGNWRAWNEETEENSADFKIAELYFDALEIEDPNQVYELSTDKALELKGGLLNPAQSDEDYMDYKLDVKEEGDYTLTYTMGANNNTLAESGEAFQTVMNPESDAPVENPAVIITKYYQELPVKQTVHLEAGEQVLRVQALVGGFSIRKITVDKKTVHTVAAGSTVIPAAQYTNANNFHAIEANGNIGYTAKGLKTDYEIEVEKSGVYTISYNYLSQNASSLVTQIDGLQVAESQVEASISSGDWYDADYADSDTAGISFRLEKGTHTLSAVWSDANINVMSVELTCKTPDPDPVVIEVEGEDGVEGSGAWAIVAGQETVGDQTVEYATFPQQWANGRWLVNLPYAGTYKIQLVAAVPTATSLVHMEIAPEGGSFSTNMFKGDHEISLTPTQTASTYETIDAYTIEIEEPGVYDIKFGSWVAGGADFKLDKMIFTCDNPVAPPSKDEPLVVEKGKELVLKEALAVNTRGSLRTNAANGNYADYAIEVKESGDYRLTYSIGSNEAAVEDAFQIWVAPQKEEITDADFTTKLEPVQVTHFYAAVKERQSIHLEAGNYILRTKALSEGFSLTQLTVTDAVMFDIADDGTTTTADAVEYNNGTNYHAIQNVTSTDNGNIGYAALGLGLDYSVNVKTGGIYSITYSYAAAGNYTLTAQRVVGEEVYDLAASQLAASTGASNWYDCPWTESEEASILLPAGENTLRVHWDFADINLKSVSLTYKGSAVDYVKDLLTALPEKDALTLADEADVNKAKASYEALTPEEKAQIDDALVQKLNEDIAQIPVLKLEKAIADNKAELDKEFAKYDEADYKAEKWEQVVAAKDAGHEAIEEAATIAEADRALKAAKTAMAAVEKKLKSISLTADNTVILAQSKAYRKNGSLNSNVAVGNYADYFVDVKEAGDYTFTYALYADEAIENAFAIRYDASEYPENVTEEYAQVSVPKIEMEGNLVKEIRSTVTLTAGEQTIRFVALNSGVRLNRITIQKKQEAAVETPKAGEAVVFQASDFTEAENGCILANGIVTKTEAGTALDYLISLDEAVSAFISYNYAYAGDKEPELILSKVDADGTVTPLASAKVNATDGTFADSEQVKAELPAGSYRLRITMKNDGVDLKSFTVSGEQKDIPAEGILLNVNKVTLSPQGTFQLKGVLNPENTTASITWSSSDSAVATVDKDGLVTAVKNGTAVISAKAGNVSAECEVTVGKKDAGAPVGSVPSFIGRVETALADSILYAGGNAQNTTSVNIVIPTGAALAKAEYASGNESVAAVSAAGVVTAKKAGTAVITVKITLTNGESASIQKQVTVKKAYIKLKKAKYSVKKGKSVQIKAAAFGSSKKITFKLANKKSRKLAKITKTGKLTGKAKGTVKVTAKSGKVKKTFKVKVK